MKSYGKLEQRSILTFPPYAVRSTGKDAQYLTWDLENGKGFNEQKLGGGGGILRKTKMQKLRE